MQTEVISVKKRVLPVFAGLLPYFQICIFLYLIWFTPEVFASISPVLLFFCVILTGPICGLLFLVTGLRSADLTPGLLAKWGLAVKLAHIPFYVAVFLLVMLAVPLSAPFFFLLDVMTLCAGSGFGIAAVLRARKEGLLSNGWTLIHIALHFCFVADVISAFLLSRKIKNA